MVGENMKGNNKGFTLVELLVVMIIFGVIIGLSFPAIKALQEKNVEKKYTTYQDSVKSGAKLYADAYGEDLFGRQENGCTCVKLDELEAKKLIKDININDVTCDTDNSFVRITKEDDNYTYYNYLGCMNTKDNTISYIYPKSDELHTFESEGCNTLCDDELASGMYINVTPKKETSYICKCCW